MSGGADAPRTAAGTIRTGREASMGVPARVSATMTCRPAERSIPQRFRASATSSSSTPDYWVAVLVPVLRVIFASDFLSEYQLVKALFLKVVICAAVGVRISSPTTFQR